MAIKYSYVPRSSSLKDADAPWLIYAAAQSTQTITLQQIAHHLSSHNSVFSTGTIIGLLTDFQHCIVEFLEQGARVDLDVLGAFYTTLRGRGAVSAEEFSTDLIDRINIRWKPSKEMEKRIQRTRLELVPNRAQQRKAKKKMEAKVNEEMEADRQRRSQQDA